MRLPLPLLALLLISATARAQLTPDEARARLEQINREAASRPTSKPSASAPTSKPSPTAALPRVVFLVENRGQLLPHEKSIKTEVFTGVTELAPGQLFSVVLAANTHVTALSKDSLVPANEQNRQAARKLLDDSEFGGKSGLFEGLAAVAKLKPDVVWLVSSGEYADNAAVIEHIRKLQSQSRLRINVVTNYALDARAMEMLTRLAGETGGSCDGKRVGPLAPLAPAVPVMTPVSPKVTVDDPQGPSIFRENP